jgi:autotransporter-associated beta strand protein
MTRIRFRRLTAVASLILTAGGAAGQTWTGNVSGNWSNGSNWSPNGVPASSGYTALSFGATTHAAMSNDIAGGLTLNSMTFGSSSPSYTLSGNQLTLDYGLGESSFTINTNNNIAIGNPIQLGGGSLYVNDFHIGGTGTGTLTLSGQLTDDYAPGRALIYSGAGTVVLGNPSNTYTGGTVVNSGTLMLATGSSLPTGHDVTVNAGAQFNLNGSSNTSATAVGALNLNGGTFRQPSGSGDYYVDSITSYGGTIDLTGTNNFWIHVKATQLASGIFIGTGTTNWIGASVSRIQNDSSGLLQLNVDYGSLLNAGIILSAGGSNPNFYLSGGGAIRLTNTHNTANFDTAARLLTNDLSTNLGTGAFGTLGTGVVTLDSQGTLAYDGRTAATAKPFIASHGGIQVVNPGVNLTLNGVISGNYLSVTGPSSGTSTVTLTATNTFTTGIGVGGNAILSVATVTNAGVNGPLGSGGTITLGGSPGYQGTLLLTGANAAYTTNLAVSVVGDYSAGAGGVINVQNAGTNLTISGPVTQIQNFPGSLVKQGPGTLTLTNSSNTYSLGTYVEAGKLAIGASNVIPAGTNVTVNGGEFNTGGYYNSSAIGTVTLNGGTMRVPGVATTFQLNKLVVNSAASTVDVPGAVGVVGLNFMNAGAAVTVNASNTWTGTPSAILSNSSGAELPITINQYAALTSGLSLASAPGSLGSTFRVTGGGTLYLTNPPTYSAGVTVAQSSRLRLDAINTLAPNYFDVTLDNGTLQYGGPTASGGGFTLGTIGGTVEVTNAATTLTLTGSINDAGLVGLTKTGLGTLALANAAAGTLHSLTINGGRVDVAGDGPLGTGPVTVNPLGTLRFTATTSTARNYALNGGKLETAGGVTLTLNGATVGGGFLREAGTFAVTGGATLSGATTAASSTMTVTGPATFSDFTNGGAFTAAAGAAAPTTFDLFTNQGSGAVTVAAGSQVNAADFQTYGTLTIAPSTSGPATQLTNVGTSPLSFNGGSRTFVSDVAHIGGPAYVDLHGQDAVVAGGLFVNNGAVFDSLASPASHHNLIADYGATIKGAGLFQFTPVTQNGGKFSPGNSPGAASLGEFKFGPGGVSNYVFQINDAAGTAGPTPNGQGQVSGWDLVSAVQMTVGSTATPGDFVWAADSAHPLTLAIDTLVNPSIVGTDVAGPMDHFDSTQPYSWTAVEWTGNYSGPTSVAALDATTAFDTSGIVNAFSGSFGWAFGPDGHSLDLTYTPVPEPGTLVLVGAAGLGLGWYRRRKAAK